MAFKSEIVNPPCRRGAAARGPGCPLQDDVRIRKDTTARVDGPEIKRTRKKVKLCGTYS